MKPLIPFVIALSLAPDAFGQAPRGELIDRTLAIVGGQVITLSDARAAEALGLVEGGTGTGTLEAVTSRLIERELILREVLRYAPPEPADAAIDARLADVRRRFAEPGALDRALAAAGLTEKRLTAWVRDDLRVQAYLAQRFATAGTPADQEIAEAYARQRAEFEHAGTTYEAAAPVLRDRLAAANRQELIADWVSDLRRRADVVLLPQ